MSLVLHKGFHAVCSARRSGGETCGFDLEGCDAYFAGFGRACGAKNGLKKGDDLHDMKETS